MVSPPYSTWKDVCDPVFATSAALAEVCYRLSVVLVYNVFFKSLTVSVLAMLHAASRARMLACTGQWTIVSMVVSMFNVVCLMSNI